MFGQKRYIGNLTNSKRKLVQKGGDFMGIVKEEDVIAWNDGNRIFCADCGDPGGAYPITSDDFDEDDIVIMPFVVGG